MSSKSIITIWIYTVSKLVRFLRHSVGLHVAYMYTVSQKSHEL